MENFKLTKRLICSVVSASMIFASAGVVSAMGNNSTGSDTSAVLAEATATPAPTEEPAATDTPASTDEPEATATATPPQQQELSLRLNVTVYSTSNTNEYKIVFGTGSGLPEIKGFKFTADFGDGVIESADFGDSFTDNGVSSKSITDDHAVTYIWKDGETSVSGSVTLANATVTSSESITASTLSVTDFTATLANGEEVIVKPGLNITDGVEMPDFSEKEQEVFDELMALPSAAELTFYRNQGTGDIYNISTYYCAPIDAAIENYEALSSPSQSKINTALSANGLTYTSFTSLQRAANAMNQVAPIMQMAEAYNGIENNSDAINFEYLKTAFESVSTEQPSALKRAPKAAEEYSAAISKIEVANGYVESALSSISEATAENYNSKIASLSVQLSNANKYTDHGLYSTYIASIRGNAEALYEDVNENYSGTYKEYMLASIQSVIDSTEVDDTITSNLPTFKLSGGINIGNSFSATITRNNKLKEQEASAFLRTYNEAGEVIQTSSEKEFEPGDTGVSVSVYPTSSDYSIGDTVTVKCYYKYNGIVYDLGEQQVTVYKSTSNTGSSGSNFNTGGTSGGNTGTVYPTAAPDSTPNPTKAPSYADENPYTDIDNYDWALEAIIGLTNAGIVNGMGDGEFNPAGNVTREQFCKMVVQLFGINATDPSSDFVAVDESKWYAPYVNAAVSAGFVQGQSDEYFGIGESIMRQDMATILYRAMGKTGDEIALEFSDADNIAAYATNAVAELCGLGIMNGYEDGSFKPRGSATRAEASKVVWEVYKVMN